MKRKRKRLDLSAEPQSRLFLLPPELLEYIALYCNFATIWRLANTCKRFRFFMLRPVIWIQRLKVDPTYKYLSHTIQALSTKKLSHRMKNIMALVCIDNRRNHLLELIRSGLYFIKFRRPDSQSYIVEDLDLFTLKLTTGNKETIDLLSPSPSVNEVSKLEIYKEINFPPFSAFQPSIFLPNHRSCGKAVYYFVDVLPIWIKLCLFQKPSTSQK